jgi:hypothetical protein
MSNPLHSHLKPNFPLILILITFLVLLLYPQIRLQLDLGSRYQGIIFQATDSDEYYLARIRDVTQGYLTASSPMLFEYQSLPPTTPFLPELTLGLLAKILAISPSSISLLSLLILPLASFLLTYKITRHLELDPWMSLAFASLVTISPHLLTDPGLILSPSSTTLPLTRPVNPQFSYPAFALCVLLILKQNSLPSFFRILFPPLTVTLLWYINPYFASFATILFLFYQIHLLTRRQLPPPVFILQLILSVFFLVPYLTSFHSLTLQPEYPLLAQRLGALPSRTPIIAFSVTLMMLINLALYLKTHTPTSLIATLVALPYLVATNQHLLTGFTVQPAHWTWYCLPFVLALNIFTLTNYLLKTHFLKLAFASTIITLCLAKATLTQITAYQANFTRLAQLQDLAPIFSWLNIHSPPNSVVLAPLPLSNYIPAYTHNHVYFSRYDHLSFTPSARLRHNLFTLVSLYPNLYPQPFTTPQTQLLASQYLFGTYYRDLNHNYLSIPPATLKQLQDQLQEYLEFPISAQLSQYQLDYLLTDTRQSPTVSLSSPPLFESPPYQLYSYPI